MLTRKFAESLLKAKKLVNLNEEWELEMDFALAWYPRHEMPAYFAKLIKSIK